MRGVKQVGAAVIEHGSPACSWRRHAKTEEAHRSLGENRSSHADSSLHDHRLNNVRQNVANDDAQVAGTESAGRFDKLPLTSREDLAAHKPGIANPASQ